MATRGAAAHPTQDASHDIQSLSKACITSGTEGRERRTVVLIPSYTFGWAARWGRHKAALSSFMRPVSGPVCQSTARPALSETHTNTHTERADAKCHVAVELRCARECADRVEEFSGHKVKLCGEHRERS